MKRNTNLRISSIYFVIFIQFFILINIAVFFIEKYYQVFELNEVFLNFAMCLFELKISFGSRWVYWKSPEDENDSSMKTRTRENFLRHVLREDTVGDQKNHRFLQQPEVLFQFVRRCLSAESKDDNSLITKLTDNRLSLVNDERCNSFRRSCAQLLLPLIFIINRLILSLYDLTVSSCRTQFMKHDYFESEWFVAFQNFLSMLKRKYSDSYLLRERLRRYPRTNKIDRRIDVFR